jgi:hypothetical protein
MSDTRAIVALLGDLIPYRECPPFWVSVPERAGTFLASLREAGRRAIGVSAGGREILAVEYGEKEPLQTATDNLQSALASGEGGGSGVDPTRIFPPAFYGAKRRRRPVVVLQGALHGSELTGTVASLNLCRVIETGQDLRGKAWPRLRELARETRLLIIPWLNPDGASRCPLHNPSDAPADLYGAVNGGIRKDGAVLAYPEFKKRFPTPPEEMAFMGCTFNDRGVNLMYDFCTVERQPETQAWMRYYLDERPDGVVIWHCNAGSLIGPPEGWLPEGCQHELSRLGGAVRQRLLREGIRIGRLSWAGLVGMGRPTLNQANAVYHVSGAMPILCELPAGIRPAVYSCDEMLDIGLLVIEEILLYAHRDGLRPYELWDKVKPRTGATDERSPGA